MYREVSIHAEVKDRFRSVTACWTEVQNLDVESSARFIKARRKRLLAESRQQFSRVAPEEHPAVTPYRTLYRQIGLDPEVTPPSTQALANRLLNQGQLPNINSAVDCVNLAALASMVPLGIFDTARLTGGVELRLSQEGEPFQELGQKVPTALEADRLVLADEEKILSIFYFRDSEHQKVDLTTRDVAILACAVEGVDESKIHSSLELACELLLLAHPNARAPLSEVA